MFQYNRGFKKEVLTQHLAQTIARKTMKILDRDISIRNEKGIIIADAFPERIGKPTIFDEQARRAIKENISVRVTEEQASKMPGIYPGIDLPVHFNEEVVGLVGIRGSPDKVEKYVGLVRMSVELMLQQAFYFERIYLEEQTEEHFIRELLSDNIDLSSEIMKKRAASMGYSNDWFYSVIIIEVADFWDRLLDVHQQRKNIRIMREHEQRIINNIQNYSIQNSEKILHLYGEKFLLLIKNKYHQKLKTSFQERREELIKRINSKDEYILRMGLGSIYRGINGLKQSFVEGMKALKLGKSFYPEKNLYNIKSLFMEHILSDLSHEKKNRLAALIDNEIIDDQYRRCIDAYCSTDMNVSKTARRLHLHRNTVIYRLNKIEEATGLNTRNFNHLLQLKLAYLCHRSGLN